MSYLALLMLREATVVTWTQSLVELASLHGPRMSLLVDLSVVLYLRDVHLVPRDDALHVPCST